MTYCCGILLEDGMVMVADTRTNAGLDNIATFRKLHLFGRPGQSVLALATAGNLGISQSVVSMVTEGLSNIVTDEIETLEAQDSVFKAAQLVGRAVREVYRIDGRMLEEKKINFDVSFLLGGQIAGGPMRLFMIYSAGNFIEATRDTPYVQIGEHKYGKPILDRAIRFDTPLPDGLKIALISMDSTMRSNLGVGMPIDLVQIRRNALRPEIEYRIANGDAYFSALRESWSEALRAAHQAIPVPPYGRPAG